MASIHNINEAIKMILREGSEYGMTSATVLTKDGIRNLKLAIELEKRFGIKIYLGGEEKGDDAYMVFDTIVVPVELKTSYVDNQFIITNGEDDDNIKLLDRLITSTFIFATMSRPDADGVEHIVDIEIRHIGSWYHRELEEYRKSLLAGGQKKQQKIRMTQIKRESRKPKLSMTESAIKLRARKSKKLAFDNLKRAMEAA